MTGCAVEVDDSLSSMPEVSRIVPNRSKAAAETWARPGLVPGEIVAPDGRHTRGFVEIQNGCDHRCTFCIIPFGRGASRSVPPERVVGRIRDLVAAGTPEAVLTGVDITSYLAPDGSRLGALVKRILRDVPDLARLRLSSIDCIEADRDLLDVIAGEPRFMPHLHLSLQSGSDLILKRMKRRHGRADAVAFCREIRRLRPEMAIGADLIAGFPTETEDHAEQSLDLIAECGIAHLHVFPYSPRPGTPAARMPAVPGDVVKARAARLRQPAMPLWPAISIGTSGRGRSVLAERGGRGRTEDFSLVRLGDTVEPGSIVRLDITRHDRHELWGTLPSRSHGRRVVQSNDG